MGQAVERQAGELAAQRDWGRRGTVDTAAAPWNAVVRVQTNLAGRCTGTLIAPDLVLTAAHCLFNKRTRAMLQPVSLHVLAGYDRGDYRAHLMVSSLLIAPGYDGTRPLDLLRQDWALLTLSAPAPADIAPLPLADPPAAAGEPAALAGFHQDRAQVLMVDGGCRIMGEMASSAGSRVLGHDCVAIRGSSGGPLLVRRGAGWAVAGVGVAAGKNVNIAAPLAAFAGAVRGTLAGR